MQNRISFLFLTLITFIFIQCETPPETKPVDEAYLAELVERRKALYAALQNSRGERTVPFTEKRAQGLRFRNREGSQTANFPESYLKGPNEEGRFTGFRPPVVSETKE